ncbi:MAG: tRNA (adenosine(37)-N6)-dimethylallyltransferase MiaA [Chloroflexota bacterium]
MIAIVGPTGIGKTALAVTLGKELSGEVVSADSRQIYRYMDIGTAKPTAQERAAIPHHLIDIVDPDQTLTMAEYHRLAYAAIDDIHRRGKIAFLVGGTGQYVTALLEGWQAPEVAPNETLRAELEAYVAEHGAEALFERLRAVDPESAARMDPYNARRTIRALEVCIVTGQPFSTLRRKVPPPWQVLELGLTMDSETLYTRLYERVDRMMADGLLDEVRGLHERGYDWRLPSMSGLGYAQLGVYLRSAATLDEAVATFKRDTRTFVRRQYTWFRRHGTPQWLETPSPDVVRQRIENWLLTLSTHGFTG